jgi:hypothetical protein
MTLWWEKIIKNYGFGVCSTYPIRMVVIINSILVSTLWVFYECVEQLKKTNKKGAKPCWGISNGEGENTKLEPKSIVLIIVCMKMCED